MPPSLAGQSYIVRGARIPRRPPHSRPFLPRRLLSFRFSERKVRVIDPWKRVTRVLAAVAAMSSFALAQPAKVQLVSGEVLVGEVIAREKGVLTLRHPVLGDLVLTSAQATEMADPHPAHAQPDASATAEVPAATNPPTQTPSSHESETPGVRPAFWSGWKRRLEAGLSGASGNTENFNARAAFTTSRKSERMETLADFSYIFRTENGESSKSRGEANARNDWILGESPWGLFALGKAEYDEFQDWDWRLSSFVGPSYTFVKDDRTLLRGRAGAGASYRIGGNDHGFTPEALLGLDAERKLTSDSRVFANSEYLPSLDEFGEFRLLSKAGYEVMLNATMSLKAGVAHRYDSDPGAGIRPSDVEYFILLGWDF